MTTNGDPLYYIPGICAPHHINRWVAPELETFRVLSEMAVSFHYSLHCSLRPSILFAPDVGSEVRTVLGGRQSTLSLFSSASSSSPTKLSDAPSNTKKPHSSPPTSPREDHSTSNGKGIGHIKGHERKSSSLRHECTAHSLGDLASFTPIKAG
ncbi:hypothetical protein BD309DRAFT_1021777 [Dichomitus squalens]|nr:hypothetical protein BD309DRAFT_1021777 [Dichomitus squalens]